jgi:hypothetical protein
MAQDLTVNIKTTSDVPQAMDKAKSATVSFSRQVEDIQKKFSTAFKDIFLGFTAPMILLQGVLGTISKLIADNQKRHEDAAKAAIEGTNDLMSAEDKYWAKKTERENKSKKAAEEAQTAREDVTLSFLENDPRGKEIVNRYKSAMPPGMSGAASFNSADNLARQKAIQEEVQKLISESAAEDPITKLEEAQRKQKLAEERIKKEEEEAKIRAAKDRAKKEAASPMAHSVSGNVIGVGANPVVTALQEQQAIAREQLAVLQVIASNGMQGPSGDVTASGATPRTPANTSPSRAALLTKNK